MSVQQSFAGDQARLSDPEKTRELVRVNLPLTRLTPFQAKTE